MKKSDIFSLIAIAISVVALAVVLFGNCGRDHRMMPPRGEMNGEMMQNQPGDRGPAQKEQFQANQNRNEQGMKKPGNMQAPKPVTK